MSDIYRMQQPARVFDRSLFSSHVGNIYIIEYESEDGLIKHKKIICPDAVTTSHFNTGTEIGDMIFDQSTPMTHIKTAATTWAEVGDVT